MKPRNTEREFERRMLLSCMFQFLNRLFFVLSVAVLVGKLLLCGKRCTGEEGLVNRVKIIIASRIKMLSVGSVVIRSFQRTNGSRVVINEFCLVGWIC